jgi:SAM-dependent methyltransferase
VFKNDLHTDTSVAAKQIHVMSMAEGFFESSVLFALLNLRIFEMIGGETKTLQYLAHKVKAVPESLERLLNAGVMLNLLEIGDDDSYGVSRELKDVLLPSAGEHYIGSFVRNLSQLRPALLKLDKAAVDARPTMDPVQILGSDEKQTREFALAMHNYALFSGKDLANHLDTSGCRTLLDVGCGPGTYAFYLGSRNPDLKLYLLDHKEVLKVARDLVKQYDINNEIFYMPMDLFKDDINGSYDIVLISNTLHMLGERISREILKKLYGNVKKGGRVAIQARFLKNDRKGERWPVFLDLIQLCITEEGRNHTVQETIQWMEEAGFVNAEYNSLSMLNANSLIIGYKE